MENILHQNIIQKINSSISDIEKHRYMRDMIAEVSDWYIIQYK